MNFELKDKIEVTKEFLSELETKSWHEIEHLQNLIINIANTKENIELLKLLNGLLTNYYIFTGGLERLTSSEMVFSTIDDEQEQPKVPELTKVAVADEESHIKDKKETFAGFTGDITAETTNFEPFEYFVDFDEPSGEALTDEDLYNV